MKASGRKEHILTGEERDPFIDIVIDLASDFLFMSREDILCGESNTLFTTPRQIVMYVVKTLKPSLSYKIIAYNLNIKDHATAIYGVKKMRDVIGRPSIDLIIYTKIIDIKEAVEKTLLGRDSDYKLSAELDREAEMILNLSPMYVWDIPERTEL